MPSIVGPDLDVYSFRREDEPIGTVGMPVRDHVNAATVISIATAALSPRWMERGKTVDFNICQGNVLTMQRNDLVWRMRGDWLMFIDDDMVWHPEQMTQLIETRDKFDLDMVGALCFRRSHPHTPTIYMREQPTSGAFNYLEDWPEDQAVECDATGMAFVIIHKRVFERIVAFATDNPGWQFPPFEQRRMETPPNFFRWLGGFGEDLQFCVDAKLSGSKIYVDTSIEVRHVSEQQIGKESFWQAIATREREIEVDRKVVNDRMGLPTLTREQARERLEW